MEAVCCSARVALAVLRFCASALPVLALPLVLLWVTPSVPELPWPAGMTGAGGLVVWSIFRGGGWAGSHCDLRSFRGAVSIPLGTAGRRTAVHAVGFGRAGFIGVVAGCAEKTQGTLQK